MPIYQKLPGAILGALAGLLLQACAENPTYAPVTTSGQNLSQASQALPSKPEAIEPIIQNSETTLESPAPEIDLLPTWDKPKLPFYKKSKPRWIKPKTPKMAVIAAVQPKLPGQYHIVKKGETLFAIGKQTGYGQQQLVEWNHLPAPYAVAVGQKLKLSGHETPRYTNNPVTQRDAIVEQDGFEDKSISLSNTNFVQSVSLRKSKKTQLLGNMVKLDRPKTATISIDKQKMLKLAFGWPIKGVVVKNFRQSKNKGIDIAGKVGQTVYAAESGKVIYGGPWLVGFGNLLIIKHDHVYLSAYANNSQLLVKEGQRVNKGQIVAQVGRTPSRKAALHFEIRKNGKSVNPLKFLPNL